MEKTYQYSKFVGENREEQVVIRCDTWEEFVEAGKNIGIEVTDIAKPKLAEQKKTIHTEQSQTNQSSDWLDKPVDTKLCPIHNVDMKARNGQYGVFYSHWLGKDTTGKSQYCNGKEK